MRSAGMAPLQPTPRASSCFDGAIASGEPPALAIAARSRRACAPRPAPATLPPLLRGLVRSPARRPAAAGSLAQRLAAAPEAEREALVLELVRSEAATVLGHASRRPRSSPAVPSRNSASTRSPRSSCATGSTGRSAACACPRRWSSTIRARPRWPRYLLEQVERCAAPGSAVAARTGPARSRSRSSAWPVAIPVGSSSPRELWRLVAAGADGISGFPADRGWDLERLYDPDPDIPGTSYAREGGFVADADRLRRRPSSASARARRWRWIPSNGCCSKRLGGAGGRRHRPRLVAREPAGVFAGISSSDYGLTLRHAQELEGHAGTGNLGSVLSGRVAYALGLEGPAITVDTACSSSLVAMHLAAQALRGGECSLALAGGVTVLATADDFIDFSRQRGLAPDGRCKSFAEAADGTGFSEGVGLRRPRAPLRRPAQRPPGPRHDQGLAVNQDGASNGLTAPNGPSQERVIRQALANAGLEPQDIDAVEAHGTGTTLGDPIEAGALLATYGQEREQPAEARLDQVKHRPHPGGGGGGGGDQDGAGDARRAPAEDAFTSTRPPPRWTGRRGRSSCCARPSPGSPTAAPRRAGVSSFGISGTNAHVILEEAPEPSEPGEGAEGAETEGTRALTGPLPFAALGQEPRPP